MTKMVERRLVEMVIRNMRGFADEAREDGEDDEARALEEIVDRLEDGTATEADWIEAIEQLDYFG